MSSQQPIPGSYKKPPFSSSPYGVTPPTIPNIPLRTTGSPANDNPRGSVAEGGGGGSYIAAATSFRPKSYKPRAASAGTGSFFSAHSQGSGGFTDSGNGGAIGEKKPVKRTQEEVAGSLGPGVSALSKALEREGVAKVPQDADETSTDKPDSQRLAAPERSDSAISVPRIPTPTNNDTRSETATHEPAQATTATPTDISEIPEEEKLRILRKHLVSAEERQQASPTPGDGVSPGGSRGTSIHGGSGFNNVPPPQAGPAGSAFSRVSGARTPDAGGSGVTHSPWDDTPEGEGNGEAFPIPYDAPGGDVT
jgi:proton-coupled amino acid transporter